MNWQAGRYALECVAGDSGKAGVGSKTPKRRPRRKLIRVCAWCRRFHDDSGVWRRGPIPASRTPTHGICSRCIERFFPAGLFPESSD